MGASDSVDVQLAIIRAEIRGMDDAYARRALEKIEHEAAKAIHMLPSSHHGQLLAVIKAARG